VAEETQKQKLAPRVELLFFPDRSWAVGRFTAYPIFDVMQEFGRFPPFSYKAHLGRITIRNNGREQIDEIHISAPAARYFRLSDVKGEAVIKDLKAEGTREYPAAIDVDGQKSVQLTLKAEVLGTEFLWYETLPLQRL
jgi:hypothetical protein